MLPMSLVDLKPTAQSPSRTEGAMATDSADQPIENASFSDVFSSRSEHRNTDEASAENELPKGAIDADVPLVAGQDDGALKALEPSENTQHIIASPELAKRLAKYTSDETGKATAADLPLTLAEKADLQRTLPQNAKDAEASKLTPQNSEAPQPRQVTYDQVQASAPATDGSLTPLEGEPEAGKLNPEVARAGSTDFPAVKNDQSSLVDTDNPKQRPTPGQAPVQTELPTVKPAPANTRPLPIGLATGAEPESTSQIGAVSALSTTAPTDQVQNSMGHQVLTPMPTAQGTMSESPRAEAEKRAGRMRVGEAPPAPPAPKLNRPAQPQMAPPPIVSAAPVEDRSAAADLTKTAEVESISFELRSSSAPSGNTQSSSGLNARPDVTRMIAQQLGEALRPLPNGTVDVALHPEELGRVRLTVGTEGTTVTLQILAERPETLDLMRRNAQDLLDAFKTMGFDSIDLGFGQGSSAESGQGDQDTDASDQPSETTALNIGEDPDPIAQSAVQGPLLANGRVDIRL